MRDPDALFVALAGSTFRRSFRLHGKELAYLQGKGISVVLQHAQDFISRRLAAAAPVSDGKQTPFRGHPVFVAQHATACCCRGCLAKWHEIPTGHALTMDEQAYVVGVLERWLHMQLANQERT